MAAKPAKESQNAGNPNQTLFLKNLPEKIKKNELKRALYMLFSIYGPVLDIVTSRIGSKGQSMRGQAHVVFRDVQTSTQAMRALQGFDFFGQEMVIVYAKGQSHIIPKLRGTFESPTTAATTASDATALQKSIFNAPPSGITSKPVETGVKPAGTTPDGGPQGTKRPRDEEEEEEEESEVEMEEDEDDAPMEEDEDD